MLRSLVGSEMCIRDRISPEGRGAALEGFYGGDEFATLEQQARDASLAGAAAEGTLGGSGTRNILRRIAPNLGSQFLSDQFGRFGQLANIGLSAGGQQAGFAGQTGANIANLMTQLGTARGAEASAYPAQFGQAFGTVGGYSLGRGLEGLF